MIWTVEDNSFLTLEPRVDQCVTCGSQSASVAWSPDGTQIVLADNPFGTSPVLFDAASGQMVDLD